ncbi:MAG: hypothetical protein A4E61_01130 [Syntrophorhabdus sp. PtaB.Bin184]|nr:MAG: hypothetical protein A4E61_01130 [Syntrophorhabdus sp. PtaB.Bin184]
MSEFHVPTRTGRTRSVVFEKKILDYRLARQSFKTDNREVLGDIALMLKDRGYLAYRITDEHFGQRFLFESSLRAVGERSLYAIPINAGFFPTEP